MFSPQRRTGIGKGLSNGVWQWKLLVTLTSYSVKFWWALNKINEVFFVVTKIKLCNGCHGSWKHMIWTFESTKCMICMPAGAPVLVLLFILVNFRLCPLHCKHTSIHGEWWSICFHLYSVFYVGLDTCTLVPVSSLYDYLFSDGSIRGEAYCHIS